MVAQKKQKKALESTNARLALVMKFGKFFRYLNIPVNLSNANDLTIEWLAEEAAKRYYGMKGVQPCSTGASAYN